MCGRISTSKKIEGGAQPMVRVNSYNIISVIGGGLNQNRIKAYTIRAYEMLTIDKISRNR